MTDNDFALARQILKDTRYVTPVPDPDGVTNYERFALYRLCECAACEGRGRVSSVDAGFAGGTMRCPACRGEGRTRELIATCATPEAVGAAIITLGREGELDECPVGILDRLPEEGQRKWVLLPWLPSARNVSDAGRTLAQSKSGKGKT